MMRLLPMFLIAFPLFVATPSGALPLPGSAASVLASAQASPFHATSLDTLLAWRPQLPEPDSTDLSLVSLGSSRAMSLEGLRDSLGSAHLRVPTPNPYGHHAPMADLQ